jgi:hypothetical protein
MMYLLGFIVVFVVVEGRGAFRSLPGASRQEGGRVNKNLCDCVKIFARSRIEVALSLF